MAALCFGKEIKTRHEKALDERPEHLNAGRRQRVGAEPIEEQMRRVGGRAENGDPPARPSVSDTGLVSDTDLPCHTGRDNQDAPDRDEAMRDRTVIPRQQEIDICDRSEYGACRNETRGRRSAVDRITTPRDGGARNGVANWAGHGAPMMADSANFRRERRKWAVYVSD